MTEREAIRDFYQKLGLISAEGGPLALHRACPVASKCWKDYENRFPVEDPARSGIPLPYVGAEYDALRLLVIGINQNDWGGLDALAQLVRDARAEIRGGAIKVFQNPEYSGSMLWHRVGCFAAAFAESAGLINGASWESGLPAADTVNRAYEFVAFTNHVKCSPVGARSAPTTAMWENCGDTILCREIELLRPGTILILGADNRKQLAKSGIRVGWEELPRVGSVWRGRATVNGQNVEVFAMPHPSIGTGTAGARFWELRQALKSEHR